MLTQIHEAGDYVILDLSASTRSTASTGGGFRSDWSFDPLLSFSTGKDRIVELILPSTATSVVGGGHGILWSGRNSAFFYFHNLVRVSGSGVTTIGELAFYNRFGMNNLRSLTTVSFPAAINIADLAFSNLNLTSVYFPNVTNIGSSAFSHNTSLTSVSFPSARTIGITAFFESGLRDARFPQVETIGAETFERNTSLTYLYIPAVNLINRGAFSETGSVTPLTITLGSAPQLQGGDFFRNVNSKSITIRIPANARGGYTATWVSMFSGSNSLAFEYR